jgi:hypothetical protein
MNGGNYLYLKEPGNTVSMGINSNAAGYINFRYDIAGGSEAEIAKMGSAGFYANGFLPLSGSTMTFTGNVVPGAVSTYDLGTTVSRFDSAFIDDLSMYGNITPSTSNAYDLGTTISFWDSSFIRIQKLSGHLILDSSATPSVSANSGKLFTGIGDAPYWMYPSGAVRNLDSVGSGGASLRVREADASPTIGSVDSIDIDQTNALSLTNPSGARAKISIPTTATLQVRKVSADTISGNGSDLRILSNGGDLYVNAASASKYLTTDNAGVVSGGKINYKVYTAVINFATGADTVLENTLGQSVTVGGSGGNYTLSTASACFTAAKTFVIVTAGGNSDITAPSGELATVEYVNNQTINIYALGEDVGVFFASAATLPYFVEIRVYP